MVNRPAVLHLREMCSEREIVGTSRTGMTDTRRWISLQDLPEDGKNIEVILGGQMEGYERNACIL